MHLSIRICLVVLAFSSCFNIKISRAEDQNSVDIARLERLKESVQSGGSKRAIDEIRSLPNDQRLRWLSQLHQTVADQKSNGGGSLANYSELMFLIENTINGNWQSQGGNSSMLPYAQGVRIDPNGVIERFNPIKSTIPVVMFPAKKAVPTSLQDLGEWQQPSQLRWISLNQLDEQVAERLTVASKTRASIAMEVLGGLYRIDYLAYDSSNDEWLLGGPAGDLSLGRNGDLLNTETGLPPVLLEDLLSVAPQVLSKRGDFGCTIDPDPTRLTETYVMSRTANSTRSLQRSPEKWIEQWRQKLGRQHAKVIGLPQDSPTGYAMLIADAHMKRMGLELEYRPTPLRSYWQEKDTYGSTNDSGLVRWWFSLTNHKIPVDPDRKIYHFASSNVQVLSETQMMNATTGERITASTPDIAADLFAKGFTQNFDKLQREFPVYGRLRHIFDLAVALEIVRSEMERGNGKSFSAIHDPKCQPRLPTAPREIDSVASTHKDKSGSISAIVSGGVSINLNELPKRLTTDWIKTKNVMIESSYGSSIGQREESENPLISPFVDKPFWR